PTLDLDADFLQLQKRLSPAAEPPRKAPVVPLTRRTPWLSIAAGGLILIVAAFLLNNYFNQVEWIVVSTGDQEQKEIQLSDGTTVTLDKRSELRYPSRFTDSLRLVELKGKAVFDVTKKSERAFHVKTHSCDVRVLGTRFMVLDYPDRYFNEVAVAEGQVRMQPYGKSKYLILNTDQKGYYQKHEHKLSKRENDSLNSMSWYSNRLRFEDTPLGEVLGDIRMHYGAQVFVDSGELMKCPFTNEFQDATIEEVLQVIVKVFGFKLERFPQQSFRLNGGSCK
ncbi:MAG: FecR domain-containing protein, partial [Bacteroidota bacterium]